MTIDPHFPREAPISNTGQLAKAQIHRGNPFRIRVQADGYSETDVVEVCRLEMESITPSTFRDASAV